MAAARKRRKLLMISSNNADTGWLVCTKCFTNKRCSEYSTNRKDDTGRLNKMCDSCLTVIYNSPGRKTNGFDEIWWRKRSYTCNTSYRQFLARQRAVPVASIKTKDLDYVCKPQDLAGMFAEQKGLCAYCVVELKPDSTTSVDHAQPLSKGGRHHPSNFRICCSDCNHLKFTRTEQQFLDFIKSYITRFK